MQFGTDFTACIQFHKVIRHVSFECVHLNLRKHLTLSAFDKRLFGDLSCGYGVDFFKGDVACDRSDFYKCVETAFERDFEVAEIIDLTGFLLKKSDEVVIPFGVDIHYLVRAERRRDGEFISFFRD